MTDTSDVTPAYPCPCWCAEHRIFRGDGYTMIDHRAAGRVELPLSNPVTMTGETRTWINVILERSDIQDVTTPEEGDGQGDVRLSNLDRLHDGVECSSPVRVHDVPSAHAAFAGIQEDGGALEWGIDEATHAYLVAYLDGTDPRPMPTIGDGQTACIKAGIPVQFAPNMLRLLLQLRAAHAYEGASRSGPSRRFFAAAEATR